MNILMSYRLQAFKSEILPQFEKFKNDNITFVVSSKYSKTWLPILISRFKLNIIINILTVEEFLKIKVGDMQFDYIIGNPPYQDGKKDGGQNKIYNDISKKCLSLLSQSGIISFITPVSVTRKSKRFSILNLPGLKMVNFDTDNSFDVGVTVCSWLVDKNYVGNVKVISNNKTYEQKPDLIYNPEITSKDFLILYNNIRKESKNLNNRMFKRNNFGPKLYNGNYDLYSRIDGDITYHSQKEPYYYQKQKCLFRLSGSYKEGFFMSSLDMDLNHVCVEASNKEFENIKTFVYSDYFIDLVQKWKKFTDSKSYDFLTYCPIFDKTKKWSNNEVKEFFEKYI